MATDRVTGYDIGVVVKIACTAASTGANLTLSGVQTVDGIAGYTDMRVLAKDQTTTSENGIYRMQSSSWIRAADCDGARDLLPGTLVYVDRGTSYARSLWVFNSSSTATSVSFGTDAITLSLMNNAISGVSSWVQNSWFPVTTPSSGRDVLGAAGTTAQNAFSAENTFSTGQLFTSSNTFSGSNAFTSSNRFSGVNTFTATNVFSATNTFGSIVVSSGGSFRSTAFYTGSGVYTPGASGLDLGAGTFNSSLGFYVNNMPMSLAWSHSSASAPSTTTALLTLSSAIASTATEIELLMNGLTGMVANQAYTAIMQSSATMTNILAPIFHVTQAATVIFTGVTSQVQVGVSVNASGLYYGRVLFSRLNTTSTAWVVEGSGVEDSTARILRMQGHFDLAGAPSRLYLATSATTVFLGTTGTAVVRWR